MAVDMFIKIDDIKGESIDHKHKDSISVLSWTWGLSQSATAHVLPGAGSGQVNVQDLTFTKYVDSSTPNLIKMCCNGKHFKQALLTIRKAGEHPVEYLKIKLMDIIIGHVGEGGGGGDDRLTENVTLNFGQFEVQYTPQKSDGTAGASIAMTWNIPSNSDKLG